MLMLAKIYNIENGTVAIDVNDNAVYGAYMDLYYEAALPGYVSGGEGFLFTVGSEDKTDGFENPEYVYNHGPQLNANTYCLDETGLAFCTGDGGNTTVANAEEIELWALYY